jgi:hypothetical protein
MYKRGGLWLLICSYFSFNLQIIPSLFFPMEKDFLKKQKSWGCIMFTFWIFFNTFQIVQFYIFSAAFILQKKLTIFDQEV